jgi:hypothetical protein
MAVGIDQEGGIVVGVVVRPQPRRAVVGASRRQPGGVESIDRLAARKATCWPICGTGAVGPSPVGPSPVEPPIQNGGSSSPSSPKPKAA